MIKAKVFAPHERGQSKDFQWRIYFEDIESPAKFAYITEMDLKFKHKMDTKDIESTRKYLERWAVEYLKDKRFEDIGHEFRI